MEQAQLTPQQIWSVAIRAVTAEGDIHQYNVHRRGSSALSALWATADVVLRNRLAAQAANRIVARWRPIGARGSQSWENSFVVLRRYAQEDLSAVLTEHLTKGSPVGYTTGASPKGQDGPDDGGNNSDGLDVFHLSL
ncbi:unnamed protein product [Cyclocybe aegerita]|uniref:Uncharacterized protein n=1 Tax=Cyclocybe aegerita TaxID=1973307 RepID=A0A8S0VXG7_CYCAE|nr:unnamed protein product [Cyclocybe aegerita]